MTKLSIVMPYYDNPQMLSRHYEHWASLPEDVKAQIEVVLVDDGSPNCPAVEVSRVDALPPLSIYRVLEDRKWHQHGARNLGAYRAAGQWLFLTDMDHLAPLETIRWMLQDHLSSNTYMFRRVEASDGSPTLDRHGKPKPHPNTFYMTVDMFDDVGGYNEYYCGYYGTDSFFRNKCRERGKIVIVNDVSVVRFDLHDVPDANTRNVARKEGRPHGWRQELMARVGNKHKVLDFSWEKVR